MNAIGLLAAFALVAGSILALGATVPETSLTTNADAAAEVCVVPWSATVGPISVSETLHFCVSASDFKW